MKTALPFLSYELRRHGATLLVGVLLLAVLPAARRVIADDYNYWDGAWNVWGAALSLYVLMPLLVLAMAASGWARERSLDTLEWLYARPLSSGLLFASRALAIAAAAILWSALALGAHRVGWTELDQALSTMPGLPGPVALYAVQLTLALGCGLLASALTSSSESSFRVSLLALVAAWIAALLPGRMVAHASLLVSTSRTGVSFFLDQVATGFLFAVAGALLVAAWRAIDEAPADPARIRRSLVPGGIAAALAVAAQLLMLHLPLLAGPEDRRAVWMGGTSALTFAPARGIGALRGAGAARLVHPIVHAETGTTVLRDVFAVRRHMTARGNAQRGASILSSIVPREAGTDTTALLIEADGSAHRLRLPPMAYSRVVGWSQSGERFAWKWTPWPSGKVPDLAGHEPTRLAILERDGSLRMVDVRTAGDTGVQPRDPGASGAENWSAAWIDDRHLLIAEPGTGGNGASRGWWSILDLEDPSESEVHELSSGQSLAAPAFHLGASASLLPTLDGDWVAVLANVEGENLYPHPKDESAALPRLVRRDRTDSRRLEVGPELHRDTLSRSMGTLGDGSLVWAAPERTSSTLPRWAGGTKTRIFRLDAFHGEAELPCTITNSRLMRFLGQSGAWAIWDTWHLGQYEYEQWGCNVETGEARALTEWAGLAHPEAAITDRGLWTGSGWVPVAEPPARSDGL